MSTDGSPLCRQMTLSNMRTHESLDMFEENIGDIIDAMRENIRDAVTELNVENEKLGKSWVAKEVGRLNIEHRVGDLIKRHNFALQFRDAKRNPIPGHITVADIERAKEYPIQEMYAGKLTKHNKTYIGLCPFHNEKTPSFHIKNNRFKCYGCDAFGDSVDFYMRTHGVSFIQAVKKLI